MNDEVLAIPLVEDAAALPNLDAICSTPGVDIVVTGPGDMALSMGIPGAGRTRAFRPASPRCWPPPRLRASRP